MLVRIISALVALPLLGFVLLKGGLYLEIAVALISMIGLFEFYQGLSKKYRPVKSLSIAMVILLNLLYRSDEFFLLQGALVLYVMVLFITYVF